MAGVRRRCRVVAYFAGTSGAGTAEGSGAVVSLVAIATMADGSVPVGALFASGDAAAGASELALAAVTGCFVGAFLAVR